MKKKKFWVILGTTSFAAILTIIGMIIDILDFKIPVKALPDITLSKNISIDYLSMIGMDPQNIYFLFNDDIVDEKKYYFNEHCATTIAIENHYNEEIVIQEIIFEATNIEQIKEPYFDVSFQNDDLGVISVVIQNTGWSDADECEIFFNGTDFELSEYFKVNTLTFKIPPLAVGESIMVPFLRDDHLLKTTTLERTEELFFDVQAFYETGEEIEADSRGLEIWIENGRLVYPARGGNATYYFGIKLDTSEKQIRRNETVSDVIQVGETKIIPICFFPNCSCQMKVRIGFIILHNGVEKVAYSQYRDLSFHISSVPEKKYTFDIYERSKVHDPFANFVITYPNNLYQ